MWLAGGRAALQTAPCRCLCAPSPCKQQPGKGGHPLSTPEPPPRCRQQSAGKGREEPTAPEPLPAQSHPHRLCSEVIAGYYSTAVVKYRSLLFRQAFCVRQTPIISLLHPSTSPHRRELRRHRAGRGHSTGTARAPQTAPLFSMLSVCPPDGFRGGSQTSEGRVMNPTPCIFST